MNGEYCCKRIILIFWIYRNQLYGWGRGCCNIEVLKNLSRCGDVMMELKASENKRFEDIKHVRNDGTEYSRPIS